MDFAISAADSFAHVRIINGIGIGLCLSRILVFLSYFVQHPGKHRVSILHFLWVFYIFLFIIEYWWGFLNYKSEIGYGYLSYVISIINVFGIYFFCVIMTPSDVSEYGDYKNYFLTKRYWIFFISVIMDSINFFDDFFIYKHDNIYYYSLLNVLFYVAMFLFIYFRSITFQYLSIISLIVIQFAEFLSDL